LKAAIIIECASRSDIVTRRLHHNALNEISEKFPTVLKETISQIWHFSKVQLKQDPTKLSLSPKRKKKCGRVTKLTDELKNKYLMIMNQFASCTTHLTVRMLKCELSLVGEDLSLSTIHSHLKIQGAKIKTLHLKPTLSDDQKRARLEYILSQADRSHGLDRPVAVWKNQKNVVHLDESWFYMQKDNNKILYIDGLGSEDGWNIKIVTQPSNSPDLNINDLGFFNSLKHRVSGLKNKALNIDQLMANVRQEWHEYDSNTLEKIWAIQISCWGEILKVQGSNQYKLPHSGINKRSRRGDQIVNLSIDVDAYNNAYQLIH
jgi:hypothetical protein